jgi:Cro/C1-type HTH DNA-binding domain
MQATPPMINKLRSVLVTKGIKNPYQLKAAVKKADPRNKGIAQGTALSAWNDPFWLPNASVLRLICRAFKIQPGDFLFYLEDDALEVDRSAELVANSINSEVMNES